MKNIYQNNIRNDQYNDESYNYQHYWISRNYENQAENIAIKRLLRKKHFDIVVDIGGGYGRLAVLLEKYANKVYLTDPSKRQLQLASTFLIDHDKIKKKIMSASKLDFSDDSIDLVNMVRVMHHIYNPQHEFEEIYRILKPGGLAIIEMANFDHFLHRIKYFLTFKKLPINPVDIRSAENRNNNEILFVNHNPETVRKQLIDAGFIIEDCLSVSNLRNSLIKKIVPLNILLGIEAKLQKTLSGIYFGPSIFFLVKKP